MANKTINSLFKEDDLELTREGYTLKSELEKALSPIITKYFRKGHTMAEIRDIVLSQVYEKSVFLSLLGIDEEE